MGNEILIIVYLSSYHRIIVSYYHCIIMALYHRIIVSSYHRIIISSYHCIIVSSYHRIIVSPYHRITVSPYHRITVSSYHCIIVSLYQSTRAKFQPLKIGTRTIQMCEHRFGLGLNREEKWWLGDENRGLSGGHRWAQSTSHGCPRPPTLLLGPTGRI